MRHKLQMNRNEAAKVSKLLDNPIETNNSLDELVDFHGSYGPKKNEKFDKLSKYNTKYSYKAAGLVY